MLLDCCWSMSIAGLTAQEIYLPPPSLFLRSSQCCSMSRAKPSWNDHDLNNFYVTLNACNVQSRNQVSNISASEKPRWQSHAPQCSGVQPLLPTKKSKVTQLSVSTKIVCAVEDKQVVSGFHRLSVSDRISPPQTPTTRQQDKPLPPIPVDNECEYFNGDDSSCLVSKSCTKPSSFRYGMHSRRSFRDCGQINYAYYEGPIPPQKKLQQHSKKKQEHESQESLLKEHREQELQEEQEQEQQKQKALCQRQQDPAPRTLRRSLSGPAGYYNKRGMLRLPCHQRNAQDLDKPEVPPRVPIPPRPAKTGDYRRWSAEVSAGNCSDEDRPPKIPPREPLANSTSRASSPKCLPIYHNGVMPATQSFAPDPKYVSQGLQRQNSEGSPCILPIMKDGEKDSMTHYFLIPQRPSDINKHEKYFVDNAASQRTKASGSSVDWTCESKRKMQSDLV